MEKSRQTSLRHPRKHPNLGAEMSEWEVKELGELCSFENGDRGSNYPSKSVQTTHGVPFINAGHLSEGKIDFSGMNYIAPERFAILGSGKILPNDILFYLRGSLGKFASVGELKEGAIASSLVIIRPTLEITHSFLTHYLNSTLCLQMIATFANGAAQPNLSSKNLTRFKIPVPPLAEQERIVAILDEAFEGLATATAHTQQKLQNAKELFQSTLQSTFQQKGKDWTEKTLTDLTESISDGDHSAPPKSSEGIPFITISNINKSTLEIDFSKTFKVPKSYYDALNTKRRPQTGDVLYTVTGSFGIPVSVTSDKEFCFQRHIGILRPNKNTNNRFLYYLMMSPVVYHQADQGATGTAQKTVSLTLLRAMRVPSIPLPEQKSIVKKLDALSAATRELEALYQSQLSAYTELKQSLLHQAFSGKL